MSKSTIAWTIAALALVFMAGLSTSTLTRHATADEVLPGGRAAKIRSYCAETQNPGDYVTIIQSVEGDHGTVLTDIYATSGAVTIQFSDGNGWKTVWNYSDGGTISSGIPIPAKVAVRVSSRYGGGAFVLSGYVW